MVVLQEEITWTRRLRGRMVYKENLTPAPVEGKIVSLKWSWCRWKIPKAFGTAASHEGWDGVVRDIERLLLRRKRIGSEKMVVLQVENPGVVRNSGSFEKKHLQRPVRGVGRVCKEY